MPEGTGSRPGRGAAATPPGLLQTVDRALQVLLATDRSHEGWTVTEVAQEFGFSMSVAHRLLATLAHQRFLILDRGSHRYRIGPSAMAVGRVWAGSRSMRLLVQPVLADLAERTGLAAIFAVPDAFHMRAVAAHVGDEGPLRNYSMVGELFPAHAGATSKVYFAHLPEGERRRIFADRPMARFTERTILDHRVLERQFERIRHQGYALTTGEYDPAVTTIAMVIRLDGAAFGSLSLGAHEQFIDDVPALVRALDPARSEIEQLIRGRGR